MQLDTELKNALAVVIKDDSNGLVEIGEKRTGAIRLILAIAEGEHEGKTIEWIGWLSEAAFEKTLIRLQEAFEFNGDFTAVADNRNLFAGLQCTITTAFEEYKGKNTLKVQWLNPVGGGGGAATLAPAEAKGLAASLTARSKALMKAAGKAPPATPPPASKAGAPGEEDEIPY